MTLFNQKKYNILFFVGVLSSMLLFLSLTNRLAFSQQPDLALESRVENLEEYVATFQPTLVELSNDLNKSIQEYTKGLESSLDSYSRKLQINIDERLSRIDSTSVVLNPFSREYQSIKTNTGFFLLAVEKLESIENGVRLHLNIGNPNFADYQDFKIKLIWGQKWAGEHVIAYDEWRGSLTGAEFTFRGKIKKGKWNPMTVDLIPAVQGQLGYLECELNVSSVELGSN